MAGKSPLGKAGAWLRDYFNAVIRALGKIGTDNVSILASGMVYSTLVAIVPCVTFLSAFLSALGGMERFSMVVGEWLRETFGEAQGAFVLEKVTQFSQNAMSLGIVGLITFVITASLLAGKIDTVINKIFRTRSAEGFMKRYGKIIIFLIVLSVFIAMSFSLAQSVRVDVYSWLGIDEKTGVWASVLKNGAQFLIVFALFFFLLFFVPNVKVKVSAAVAGSVLGTVVMSIFYLVFTHLIIYSVKYSVIYGSLASILLVLLFLYIVWYIVILTSEVTFIYQFRPEKDEAEGCILTPQKEIEESLRVLIEIARSFEKGEGGISTRVLSSRSRVIYFRVISYLRILEEDGFIKELTTTRYLLSRPSEKIELREVIDSLFSHNGVSDIEVIRCFKNAGLKTLDDKTLKDLL